jgi:CYTH domain-containing protein
MSSQRIGKYACLELERRYLLQRPPDGLLERGAGAAIIDHYLEDTRLRLRHMRLASGEQVYKFAQKYQAAHQDETQTTITNLYLSEAEYQRLAQLGGKQLVKTRYRYTYQDREYGIDVFEGELAGLVLAETECASREEVQKLSKPDFALEDVTADPFFKGGNLVNLTNQELSAELERRIGSKMWGKQSNQRPA